MSVDLSALPIASAVPTLIEFGGVLTPSLGGPAQRVDRLGNRWSWQFETAPMLMEPVGRRFAALLGKAKREGALIKVPQPDFDPIAPGSPSVGATTLSGRSVPIAGMTRNHPIRLGQWVSIVHGGQRYLDMVEADTASDAEGAAVLTIQNLLRVPLATGDAVELGRPMVEGSITGVLSWPLQDNRMTVFSFGIEEDA